MNGWHRLFVLLAAMGLIPAGLAVWAEYTRYEANGAILTNLANPECVNFPLLQLLEDVEVPGPRGKEIKLTALGDTDVRRIRFKLESPSKQIWVMAVRQNMTEDQALSLGKRAITAIGEKLERGQHVVVMPNGLGVTAVPKDLGDEELLRRAHGSDKTFVSTGSHEPCNALVSHWAWNETTYLTDAGYRGWLTNKRNSETFEQAKVAFVVWAVLFATLYSLGCAIAWVRRGFTRKA